MPLNLLPLARASTANPDFLDDLLALGAGAFKVHEDVGAFPWVVDGALAVAERHDVQVALHADGLNESATLDETLAAIDGRAVHAYHVEGSGGGPVTCWRRSRSRTCSPRPPTPTIPVRRERRRPSTRR